MKEIHFENPHRRKHFDFFRRFDQPHFNICANVEITELLRFLKGGRYRFTPAVVYCIARAANDIPEFRRRIRGERVFEHEAVHPSFTVKTEVADVFSFCTVPYSPHFEDFILNAEAIMDKMSREPSLEDEEGRDDFLFLSSFPWVSFTGFQHAMHYHPVDSVPRFAWGRYFEENGKIKMPLAVQAHHALVDGIHTGRFFENVQELFAKPEIAMIE